MKRLEEIIYLLLSILMIAGMVNAVAHAEESAIVVPKGLSDTAFQRAFDDALEQAEPNQEISWASGSDTPTADQVFNLYLNYTTFNDTLTQTTQFDTRTLSRSDVPLDLKIIEKFDTNTLELVDYYKEVELSN